MRFISGFGHSCRRADSSGPALVSCSVPTFCAKTTKLIVAAVVAAQLVTVDSPRKTRAVAEPCSAEVLAEVLVLQLSAVTTVAVMAVLPVIMRITTATTLHAMAHRW